MTRSTRSVQTYKQAKKAFKQEASDAGYRCKPEINCMWSTKVLQVQRDKAKRPPLHCTRNPRRMDGKRWDGSAFVCPGNVDDGDYSREDSWVEKFDGDFGEVEDTRHGTEVCLMDYARPAKPRGAKQEFELVEKLPSVIALDEEIWESYSTGDWYFPDDVWEDDFLELEGPASKKTFADVLREGG